MCGNGIRCLVKYCYDNSIIKKKEMKVETKAGIKSVSVEVKNGNVKTARVDMGLPILQREKIPVKGTGKFVGEQIEIDGQKFKAICVSVGNPHCIIFVDNVETFPVEIIGPKIENHALFPNRTNVEFVQVLAKNEVAMRVWERGVGETSACGTGACASVVAGNLAGLLGNNVKVHLPGGILHVEYSGTITLIGEAEKSFEGEI